MLARPEILGEIEALGFGRLKDGPHGAAAVRPPKAVLDPAKAKSKLADKDLRTPPLRETTG
jgi:hypothetical protein